MNRATPPTANAATNAAPAKAALGTAFRLVPASVGFSDGKWLSSFGLDGSVFSFFVSEGSALPQVRQNAEPSGTSPPHFGQNIYPAFPLLGLVSKMGLGLFRGHPYSESSIWLAT